MLAIMGPLVVRYIKTVTHFRMTARRLAFGGWARNEWVEEV
jgi:hypothetical protein